MIEFKCPKCGETLSVPDSLAGNTETCPDCGNVAVVPHRLPPRIPPLPAQPHQLSAIPAVMTVRGVKGISRLGIAALVLGLVACLACWIPYLAITISVGGIIFGIVGLRDSLAQREGIGMPVAGVSVCTVALVIAISFQKEQNVEEMSPIVTVSAAQLFREYKMNEVAADQEYRGRVLLVQGTVTSIGKDISGSMYITLNPGYEMFGAVQCMFDDDQESQLARIRPQQSVSVKGKCDGKMLDILLLRSCVLQ